MISTVQWKHLQEYTMKASSRKILPTKLKLGHINQIRGSLMFVKSSCEMCIPRQDDES